MRKKIGKVLVTGGAGLIGSNLVDALLREGAGVKVLDMDLRPLSADPRAGDILESVADIGRARATLGYEVDYTFDDGPRLTHYDLNLPS